MLASVLSWLNIPITVRPFSSVDTAGDRTYGADVLTKCYAEFSNKVVVNKYGKEVVSNHTLYLKGDITISDDDKIFFNNVWFEIKSLGTYYDEVGNIGMIVVHI